MVVKASEATSSPERSSKRRRIDQDANVGRRKSACQSCRLRKIKCDLARPECALCRAAGNECVYLPEPVKQTLESVAEILGGRLDHVTEQLQDLREAVEGTSRKRRRTASSIDQSQGQNLFLRSGSIQDGPQSSRDFSHIPAHCTTADTVLMWPIYNDKFLENYLIQPLLSEPHDSQTSLQQGDLDSYTMSATVAPLDEEHVPSLVDSFLQNVHTKNPVIDVETLVQKSRDVPTRGLGWDPWSCLILLACALGTIAKPFGKWETLPPEEIHSKNPATKQELQQAENCFVLACRRLGTLKPTMLAAQCHFFAGVYLMYTLRPMLSWQQFHQASITYQLYLKTNGRLSESFTILQHISQLNAGPPDRKQARLEQRLYWSCFKSEAEFRVELPLPQSEIADYDAGHLFPSPPSPPSPGPQNDSGLQSILNPADSVTESPLMRMISSPSVFSPNDHDSIHRHAKHLCREEESWYYYLTEVALRRIGNRIINTFFTTSGSSWMNIEPYLDIAVEFEAQVSSWYANLPPAMQKYETSSAIRMPARELSNGREADFVSRELSWATENRLLEMRSWLYQPFLYYLIHARPQRPGMDLITSPVSNHRGSVTGTSSDSSNVLWTLIIRGIECNVSILETRSLPHRHHGLWYDLRAIMTASLILLAIIKAGYDDLIPEGAENLVGHKVSKVLSQLRLWSLESPEMTRHADVLNSLLQETSVQKY